MSSDSNISENIEAVEDVFCPVLMIASPGLGDGKTTLTALLARLHRNKGRKVQVFKAGSDFVDLMTHQCASGQEVFNIDLWMVGELNIRRMLYDAARHNDLIIIDCDNGLFDGRAGNTGADLARFLGVPIVVVIDAQALGETFGAIAHGLQSFQQDLPFCGVIANSIVSPQHFQRIKQGTPARIPLIGGLIKDKRLVLPGCYLGGLQEAELTSLDQWLDEAVAVLLNSGVSEGIERLPEAISFAKPDMARSNRSDTSVGKLTRSDQLAGQRIAIAKDPAFCFIYQANIELLKSLGAELVFFSPLNNEAIPDCGGVWLPGGYPELFADQLSGCRLTQASLKVLVDNNIPVLAEGGGMLFLLDELVTTDGFAKPMCGLVVGRAYIKLDPQGRGLQTMRWPEGALRGHTFHHVDMSLGRQNGELLAAETALEGDKSLKPTTVGVQQWGRGRGEALFQIGAIRCSCFHAYFPSNSDAVARFFGIH